MRQDKKRLAGKRWRSRRVVGGALAVLLAFGGTVAGVTVVDQTLSAESAAAAATGAGFSDGGNGFLGNYITPDGSRAYCIDVLADWPSGSTSSGFIVSSWGASSGTQAVSGTNLAVLNYGLRTWGQTGDPYWAAAVNAFVYAFSSQNHPGYAGGIHYINSKAPGEASTIIPLYDTIWNTSWAAYNSPGSNSATLDIVMANSYDGYVSVSVSPISATGTLTLSGATVVSTGLTTAPVANGSLIPIKGNPLDSQNKYAITANATFTGPGGAASNVTMYTTGAQQRLVRGGTAGTVSFSATKFVTDPLALEFSPIVGTQTASQFVQPGDSFVDSLVADVAAGSPAWRQRVNGTYFGIVAQGTLYGPFTDLPVPSADPPVGAPVVGTVSITLDGPGTYQSPNTLVAPEAGYYTWVWTIDAADQGVVTQSQLPADYHFADQFGLVAETHIVPIDVAAVSQASAASVGLGGTVSDQLTVVLKSGTWLTENGDPVPAVFNGTAYFVPGDTPPAISASIPADATAIGTATVTAPGPGVYPASTSVTAPAATGGYISWVWTVDPTSPYGSYFLPWSDLFGIPAETTRVDVPFLSSLAVPETALGNPAYDTATVGGTMPAGAPYLGFEAYLQVDGEPALCDGSTLVFDSLATIVAQRSSAPVALGPVVVTGPGDYDSPEVTFDDYGTYFWIASLYSEDGQLITRGGCGDPSETTVVSPADVRSSALAEVSLSAPAHDIAIVTGLVQTGASVVFDAYLQSTETASCTPSNRVFSSADNPVPVTGPGEYVSPPADFADTGKVYWVETLLDRDGNPMDVGECGVTGETTFVSKTSLAHTGAEPQVPLLVGGGLIGAGGLVVLALYVWRRRAARG